MGRLTCSRAAHNASSIDTAITKTLWFLFLGALSALPLWFLTSDPLSAVIVLTVTDLAGFRPTTGLPRAYDKPLYEQKCSIPFEQIFESYPERCREVYP